MVVVGIMIYLAFRFEWKFAVAAIIANLHDVVIILGFFAFFQWEFSLAVLAAVLAVLGYSVNESVVIFDRIRENFRRYRKLTTVQIIDNAITSHHQPHHHHPRLHADDGAVDAVVRRPDAALLRAGADHRHPVRHLFVGVRGRGHRHVAGRQARRPGQGAPARRRRPRTTRTPAPPSSRPTHGRTKLPAPCLRAALRGRRASSSWRTSRACCRTADGAIRTRARSSWWTRAPSTRATCRTGATRMFEFDRAAAALGRSARSQGLAQAPSCRPPPRRACALEMGSLELIGDDVVENKILSSRLAHGGAGKGHLGAQRPQAAHAAPRRPKSSPPRTSCGPRPWRS